MRSSRVASWLFVILWIAALAPAVWYLHDLRWPSDVDGFRDLAAAQGLADGRWLSDSMYAGEAAWYSPLVPGAIAMTSAIGHVDIPRAYVLTGLWLNGVVPLVLFLCAGRLLGGGAAAFAGAVAFVLLPAHPLMWASGTYGPWPFPAITAQVPFLFGVWAWARALERPSTPAVLLSGVLLGLTFLAHAAPALVLAGLVALTSLATIAVPVDGISRAARVRSLLVVAATSLAVASPFLLRLGLEYRFHVLNRAPATWIDPEAQPMALLGTALSLAALPQWLLAAAGAWWIRRRVRTAGQLLLAAWPVAAAAGYALAVASQTSPTLPAIVPAYHYPYVLRTSIAIMTGCGICAVGEWISAAVRRVRPVDAGAIAMILATVAAVALYPQYLRREAFERSSKFSRGYEGMPEREVYRWIRAHADRGSVFVASDDDGLRIVAPAGRAVVSLDQFFSNPYADLAARYEARNRMVDALRAGDARRFEADRRRFGVTHVLARDEDARAMSEHGQGLLVPAFRHGGMTVFTVQNPTQ